jgi:hypothetical protein
MCAKQKRGSVPDLAPIRALLSGLSPLFDERRTAQRQQSIRSYGTPFQQVP